MPPQKLAQNCAVNLIAKGGFFGLINQTLTVSALLRLV